MFFETKYGKIKKAYINGDTELGMFFETKYGKITISLLKSNVTLGMFFETKYGKILTVIGDAHAIVRDVL